MSTLPNRSYLYKFHGRYLHLYKLSVVENTTIYPAYVGSLIYPNEDITDGLRVSYTNLDAPFVKESLEDTNVLVSASTISFSGSTITDSGNGFSDFADGDSIRIRGSASNDGDAVVTTAAAGSLICSASSFTTEAVGESITIFQIPTEDTSPSETSHINLNKLLSLAVVDYVKARYAADEGKYNIEQKLMRDFRMKIGDDKSNQNNNRVSYPKSPYALR